MDELKWVEFLTRNARKGHGVIKGIGDDCALVSLGDQKALLKSDLFVEGVHFPAVARVSGAKQNRRGLARPSAEPRGAGGTRDFIDFKTIGMRAVGRVLSDFAACGGGPNYIGVSLGLPKYINETQLKEILNGVLAMSNKYDFSLVGGDTGRAPVLFLDVWGVGQTEKFISRNGAKIGDYIFVSGKLGKRKFNESFTPRIKEARYLTQHFKVNSMIDISDGFALDMYRLAKESDKGVLLYQEKIPVTKGNTDLYRGEDYELIFTIDKSEKKIAALKERFFFVGLVTHKRLGCVVLGNKKIVKLAVKGYTHF